LIRPDRLRLLGVLGAVLALVALASGVLVRRGARERILDATRADLARAAQLVRDLLDAHALPDGATEPLHAVVVRAARSAGARVSLISDEGRLVADSGVAPAALDRTTTYASRPEVAAALEGKLGSAERESAGGQRLLHVAIPRRAERPGSGAIVLSLDLAHAEEGLGALDRAIFGGAVLGLVAGLLALALWLDRTIDRPLGRIGSMLTRIRSGDLAARSRVHAPGAVGEISTAIDQMAGELELRLREVTGEKDQLSAVLSGMAEGVLVVGPDGRIELANTSLRDLFGFRGEMTGRRPIEAIRHAGVEDALGEAARAGVPIVREIALGASPTSILRVHASSFPGAEAAGVVAVFSDVTELRRVEAMRRDFVTHASHELKTPITAIRGFAEMLAEGTIPESDQKRVLAIVRAQVRRLERLVEDLLELARAESTKLELEPRSLDLVAFCRAALEGLEARFAEKRIDVALLDRGAGHALADPDALEHVLSNLLDNALKYTEPGGHVEIEIADAGERVRLCVRDTGIGIPEADRARIFERFYRVDKARSSALGGTGLGLAIVKHLVRAMQGEVSVESTPGVGSSFHVHLPRA